MRINRFVAQATGMSRRAADKVIFEGHVKLNGAVASPGILVQLLDQVTLDDRVITPPVNATTIILHKPVGYVSSRNGQGSRTIYDLLPSKLHELKPVGRLDKDSSGLLMLTNDGELANSLTHPRYEKEKVYEVQLNRPLTDVDKAKIKKGITLEDGISKLKIRALSKEQRIKNNQISAYEVRIREGRNRQIRRTFEVLGYQVRKLHRLQFGQYQLEDLKSGDWRLV